MGNLFRKIKKFNNDKIIYESNINTVIDHDLHKKKLFSSNKFLPLRTDLKFNVFSFLNVSSIRQNLFPINNKKLKKEVSTYCKKLLTIKNNRKSNPLSMEIKIREFKTLYGIDHCFGSVKLKGMGRNSFATYYQKTNGFNLNKIENNMYSYKQNIYFPHISSRREESPEVIINLEGFDDNKFVILHRSPFNNVLEFYNFYFSQANTDHPEFTVGENEIKDYFGQSTVKSPEFDCVFHFPSFDPFLIISTQKEFSLLWDLNSKKIINSFSFNKIHLYLSNFMNRKNNLIVKDCSGKFFIYDLIKNVYEKQLNLSFFPKVSVRNFIDMHKYQENTIVFIEQKENYDQSVILFDIGTNNHLGRINDIFRSCLTVFYLEDYLFNCLMVGLKCGIIRIYNMDDFSIVKEFEENRSHDFTSSVYVMDDNQKYTLIVDKYFGRKIFELD